MMLVAGGKDTLHIQLKYNTNTVQIRYKYDTKYNRKDEEEGPHDAGGRRQVRKPKTKQRAGAGIASACYRQPSFVISQVCTNTNTDTNTNIIQSSRYCFCYSQPFSYRFLQFYKHSVARLSWLIYFLIYSDCHCKYYYCTPRNSAANVCFYQLGCVFNFNLIYVCAFSMLNTMNRSRALCLVLRRVILVNLFRGPNTQQAQPGTSIFVFVYLYLLNFCICVFVFGQFFLSINQNCGFFRTIFAPMSHKKKESKLFRAHTFQIATVL